MAVDDAAADVSVSGGTPALCLKGARATPYGGSHASRSEEIAEDDASAVRPSPVPVGGLAGRASVIHEPEGRRPPPDTDPSLGESKGTKSQRIDYMNNPHLCLTAAQQSSTRLARMRRRAWSRPCRGGRPR